MSKRVLLAEQNDTIRRVAETVLRQNGFDVIAVNCADKLFEILELSAPDILLIDANMNASDGQPTHQKVRTHAQASKVPLALLADEYHESLGLPVSAVVLRPFDPANLLSQLNQVMGSQPVAGANADLLSGASLDDEFLDSALGLDDIVVTASEDMSKTGHVRIQPRADSTKIVGIGQFESRPSEPTDSGKIESLMISNEESDIKPSAASGRPPAASVSETSGLQLADDQYGLADPGAFQMEVDSGDHDYNWFVNSMKTENDDSAEGFGSQPANVPGGDKLNFADSAGMLDPVTPGPASAPTTPPSPANPPQVSAGQSSGGMDKFIDEFRQEVEKLDDEGPESIVIPGDESVAPEVGPSEASDVAVQTIPTSDQASWEDKIENVTPEHLRIFTRALAGRLADKIAGLILARIDQDKLLRLIKDELLEEVRKKS